MRVIIVEDEMHNYRLLRGMIEKLRPEWNIVQWFESVSGTVSWLKKNPAPDLIFMDIQLTDGISFSIFDQVKVESIVIFTTAYDEYAVRAFEVSCVDYLLKPLKMTKLENSLERFEYAHQLIHPKQEHPEYTDLLNAIKQQGEKKYRKRFLIAGATAYTKLDVEDIAWFYTENRVTTAVTYQGKKHIVDLTIEKLEEELDPEFFFRTNRSTIVHIDAIHKFENHFGGKLILRLKPPFNDTIIISRLKASDFKEWVGK